MKYPILFVCAFLVTVSANCQTFFLLDRKAHSKVIVTDTVTKKNLSDGYFPVYVAEFDSMVSLIDKFRNLKDDGLNRKFYNSDDFKTRHIKFQIESIKRTYGDGYDINLISAGQFGETILKIADSRSSLSENEHNIKSLLSYLKSRKKEIDKGDFVKDNLQSQ